MVEDRRSRRDTTEIPLSVACGGAVRFRSKMSEPSITIRVPGNHLMGVLLGEHDRHLRRIEDALPDADITVPR